MPSTKAKTEFTKVTDNTNFEQSLASRPFLFVIGKEKREFHVHKEVIGQLSPALSALVNGNTDEAIQGRIEWPDLDNQTFVRFANYAYSQDYVEAEPELLPYDAYSASDHATSQQHGDDDGVSEGELNTAGSATKSEKASIATPPTPPPQQEPRVTAGSSRGSSGTVVAAVAADVEEHEESDGNEVVGDEEGEEEEEEEEVDEDEDEDEEGEDSDLDEGDSEEEEEGEDEQDEDNYASNPDANANANAHTPDIFQSAQVWSSFNFSSSLYSFMQSTKASYDVASNHHNHQIDENNEDNQVNDDITAGGDRNGKDVERPSPQLKKRRRMNSHSKPRRNHKYETIIRFANLTTPSMHARPNPSISSPGSSRRNSRSSFSPHSYSWHPRKNIGARESYEPVFLSHVRLYLLADKYAVQPLRTLTLYRLHKSLLHFTIYQERIPDLVKLAEEVYDNTDEDDEARAVVSSFFGCIIENVRGCKEFSALVKKGGAFADDLVLQMVERLD